MDHRARLYLDCYLDTLSDAERSRYTSFDADHFCSDEAAANTCADLVRRGVKQATCSLKHWYDMGEAPMPKVGNLQVVTDWAGKPMAIIEVTRVRECRFCDVDEAFARAEGEGDQTLAWWREAHRHFFARECQQAGIEPSEEMMLVQEWFKVVYRGA